MARKKSEDIDNSFELGAYAIRNWWKVILILVVLGVVLTGFKVQCGKNSIEKDPVHFKNPMSSEVKNE